MVRKGACGALLALSAALCWVVAVASPAAGVPLPDERAYEMVSPPAKNGSEVLTVTGKAHVAADGNAVTFSALGGFGQLQGASFDTEYLSRRTGASGTNGWITHGITPLGGSDTLDAATFAQIPTYVNAFTPDLGAGIFKSWRPLTGASNVIDVTNLYRITGLNDGRTAAELMTDADAPLPPWPPTFKLFHRPFFAGAATDLSHVVFESDLHLTTDAPALPPFCAAFGFGCPFSLYENAGGSVRLVGRIPNAPDTACDDVVGPACITSGSSQAGISPQSFYSERMISDDGRRVLFQVPAGAESGAIYLREDGVRTVELAQDGQLWDASADGSRIFFVSNEPLVSQDVDGAPDLYMYDADAPTGDRLTLVSASSVSDGYVSTVIGASADGQYVYFVCDGQLVPGEPAANTNGLYVWHDGALAFIGQFENLFEEARRNSPRTDPLFAATADTARVAPDGRHLLFMALSDAGFRGRGGFGGYDHAGHRELYLYSADTARLACATCNPSGRAATADAVTEVRENEAASVPVTKLTHSLADDGERVFFSTAEALVPEDVNGTSDAYEFDATTGRVHLLSSGTDPSPSYFMDSDANGDNVFFLTRQQLLSWDVDDSYDLYDARVHGGLPEPAPAAARCDGETCLPPVSSTPARGVASDSVRGAGDAAPRLRAHRRRCGRRTARHHARGKRRCTRRRARRHTGRASMRDERSGR